VNSAFKYPCSLNKTFAQCKFSLRENWFRGLSFDAIVGIRTQSRKTGPLHKCSERATIFAFWSSSCYYDPVDCFCDTIGNLRCIRHERDVREEWAPIYAWREQAVIEWSRRVISIVACCHSVKLCALVARDLPIATALFRPAITTPKKATVARKSAIFFYHWWKKTIKLQVHAFQCHVVSRLSEPSDNRF